MSARARVITYSGYNNLIYTIRSSIRNQSHISHSRTQQKELMSFLQSTIYLLFSILVTYVRLFWCRIHFSFSYSLILVFCLKDTEHKQSRLRLWWIWSSYEGIAEGVGTTHMGLHLGKETKSRLQGVPIKQRVLYWHLDFDFIPLWNVPRCSNDKISMLESQFWFTASLRSSKAFKSENVYLIGRPLNTWKSLHLWFSSFTKCHSVFGDRKSLVHYQK